jgi:hypothetical protein
MNKNNQQIGNGLYRKTPISIGPRIDLNLMSERAVQELHVH